MYLSNSVSNCQEWRIAGINHDNTSGTIDLISKYAVKTNIAWNSTAFINSNVRKWLNGDMLGGFDSSIRDIMKYIKYDGSSSTTYKADSMQDKIKCPSIYELGFNTGGIGQYYPPLGSPYPVFDIVGPRYEGSSFMNDNKSAVFTVPGGSTDASKNTLRMIATRNRQHVNDDTYVAYVNLNGSISADLYITYLDFYYASDNIGIAAIIRF